MKFKSLFAAAFAAVAVLAGCQPKEEPVEEAKLSVSPQTLSFESAAGEKTVQLISTREWKAQIKYEGDVKDWLSVSPESGSACPNGQNVTITAKANEGKDRKATVTFSIGLLNKSVEVSQVGKKGPDPVNDGSKEHPFTVPEAIQKCIEAGETPTTDFFYIKGFVSEIKEITDATGFGNATFYIKEAKDAATDAFYCYRVKYFNGVKFPSIDALKVGDDVVVKAQLVNFKGNTPETQNGEMYSINGKTAEDEPEPQPITGDNLLVNGSFESWTGAKPEAWDFKNGNATLTKVGGAKEGSNACEIGGDPEGKTNYRLMSKEYTLNPGTYQIQVYVKGEGLYRVGYAKLTDHVVKDTSNDYIYIDSDPIQATSDWTLHFVEFKITEQTSVSITVMNNKKGNGKSVIVDDVRLVTQDGGLVPDVPVEVLETESVAEVIAAPDDTPVKLSNALVVAAAKTGYLVTDAQKSAYLFVFKGNQTTETAPEVGDVVTVEATKGTYQKFAQLSEPKTTVVSSGSTVTHPSAEDISTNFDSFSSTSVKYVSFTGKLSISGSYYNVSVPGASANIGSLISPKQDLSAYKDVDNVRYEGYFVYVTGGKYINIVLTKAEPSEAKFFNVTPLTSTIDAAATTVDITLSSNVAWSASSDTDGFTLDKASGEGNGTITVTCPENVSDEARTVKITVSTEADVTTKSYEVVITQNGVSPAGSGITLTFPDDNKDNNKVSSYTDTWTAKVGDQEFTLTGFNNNNWNNWTYIKCGRKNNASVATIYTKISFAVKTVVVTVDNFTGGKVNAFKLEVASDADFKNDIQTVNLTIAKDDNTFTIPSPVANAHYRLTVDCASGSANGLVTVSKLVISDK